MLSKGWRENPGSGDNTEKSSLDFSWALLWNFDYTIEVALKKSVNEKRSDDIKIGALENLRLDITPPPSHWP